MFSWPSDSLTTGERGRALFSTLSLLRGAALRAHVSRIDAGDNNRRLHGIAPEWFAEFLVQNDFDKRRRSARLRLARFADVYMPIAGKVRARVGQRVLAGTDLLGTVPHPG